MNRRIFLTLCAISLADLGCSGNKQLASNFEHWENLSKKTRFEKLFQEGYSFSFKMPWQGIQTVNILIRDIGKLNITSGKIIVCDPLMGPDLRYFLTKQVKVGTYPIILSFAKIEPFGGFRIAAAKVIFSDEPTTDWEIAEINEQKLKPGSVHNYGVDSGTGSFMDCDVAKIIAKLPFEDFEGKFCSKVIAEMEKNEIGKYKTAGWANFTFSEETKANLVTFHSGWGDGGYISYWGNDKNGNPTSLITDFDLFFSNNT